MATGAFTHRPLPLPLRWQRPETSGHDDAVTVGVIDTLRIDDEAGHVWGEGELFDDINPAANPRLAEDVNEAKFLLGKKAIGPSVDPGHASAVAVVAGTDTPVTEQSMFEQMLAGATEAPATETLFTAYEIAGATLVPVPAFAECRPFELITPGVAIDTPTGLALTASQVRTSGWTDLPIATRDRAWDGDAAAGRLAGACGLNGDSPDWGCYASGFLYRDTEADPHTRGAYSWPLVDVIDGERTLVPAAVYAAANILAGGRGGSDIPAAKQASMRTVVGKLYRRLAKHFDDPSIRAPWGDADGKAAILAAATLGIDPSVFADPQLSEITPITRVLLDNGLTRVFGHVATHDTCLVGQRDVCTTAPYSSCEYTQFHRYHSTDDGSLQFPLPVGRLTAAFGTLENTCRCCPGNDDHACANISFGAAIAHHDRMETLAYVRAGEDEANNAIWFSGIEAPQVSEQGQKLLARRKISGDWRFVRGDMEMTEILVLNRREPGFPLPRASMRGGRQLALTAAGVVRAPMDKQEQTVTAELAAFEIDYDRLGVSVAEALILAAQTDADDELAYNKSQKRGPGGRWVSMGGRGAAGGRRGGGGGNAGGPDRRAADRQTIDEARDQIPWLRKQAGWGKGDAKRIGAQIENYEQAVRDGDDQRADDIIDDLRRSSESYRAIRERGDGDSKPADGDRELTMPAAQRRQAANLLEEQAGAENDDALAGELWAAAEMLDGESDSVHLSPQVAAILRQAAYDLDSVIDPDQEDPDLVAAIEAILRQLGQRATTAAAPEGHSGAMLALRMTDQDAARLCVHDGLPIDELHSTLAYLGEADQIAPEVRERMVADVTKLASKMKPFSAEVADLTVFNPGNNNDREPALVLGLTGQELTDLHGGVTAMSWDGHEMPQQFSPYKPHITLRQPAGDINRIEALADRMGPVTFDRMRLAFGDEVIDVPLGGPVVVGQGYDVVNAGMALRARAALAKLAINTKAV